MVRIGYNSFNDHGICDVQDNSRPIHYNYMLDTPDGGWDLVGGM